MAHTPGCQPDEQGGSEIKSSLNSILDAEPVLLWAHLQKAGGSGKEDHHAGKGGRKQGKRETQYEMDGLSKGSHRLTFARTGHDILEMAYPRGLYKLEAMRQHIITNQTHISAPPFKPSAVPSSKRARCLGEDILHQLQLP